MVEAGKQRETLSASKAEELEAKLAASAEVVVGLQQRVAELESATLNGNVDPSELQGLRDEVEQLQLAVQEQQHEREQLQAAHRAEFEKQVQATNALAARCAFVVIFCGVEIAFCDRNGFGSMCVGLSRAVEGGLCSRADRERRVTGWESARMGTGCLCRRPRPS
eukprot:2093952-Rhodomonas_salina.2